MATTKRALIFGVAGAAVFAGCVSEGPRADSSEEAEAATVISVTVPPERLTPFCQAMIDLTDRVRSGDDSVDESVIVETYRSIVDEVPVEIASDFAAVLSALETGAPPPTDPPPETIQPETIQTVPGKPSPSDGSTDVPTDDPSVDSPADPGGTTPSAGEVVVDEGFASGTTPGERINNYVTFSCSDTQNNPGPPPTQPSAQPDTDG